MVKLFVKYSSCGYVTTEDWVVVSVLESFTKEDVIRAISLSRINNQDCSPECKGKKTNLCVKILDIKFICYGT